MRTRRLSKYQYNDNEENIIQSKLKRYRRRLQYNEKSDIQLRANSNQFLNSNYNNMEDMERIIRRKVAFESIRRELYSYSYVMSENNFSDVCHALDVGTNGKHKAPHSNEICLAFFFVIGYILSFSNRFHFFPFFTPFF